MRKFRIFNRWPTWDWHVFKPLRGHSDGGYWAWWLGPFKIVVWDAPKPRPAYPPFIHMPTDLNGGDRLPPHQPGDFR